MLTMTLAEIKQPGKAMLTPADIAPVLGCDPNSIRLAARTCPELLGFPVIVTGTRVKIPKRAFLRYMRGLAQEEEA